MRQHRHPGLTVSTLLCILAAAAAGAGAVAVAAELPAVAQEEQGGASDAESSSPSAEVLELGGEIYRSQCMSCHGREGRGDGPAARFVDPKPRDLTSRDWRYAEDGTVESIAALVAAGIEDTAMEPFEELLTEEEILAVATYVVHEVVPDDEPAR